MRLRRLFAGSKRADEQSDGSFKGPASARDLDETS
jgi:hypothetical protein